jgi:hypothetical protein
MYQDVTQELKTISNDPKSYAWLEHYPRNLLSETPAIICKKTISNDPKFYAWLEHYPRNLLSETPAIICKISF